MGSFVYNRATKVEIEDRALLHLQAVICEKLSRREGFAFSWIDDPSTGAGKTTVWLSCHSELTYRFYGSRVPSLNRAWVRALAFVADSPSGLYLVPEPIGTAPTTSNREPVLH